jgi:hypothetical protein
MVRGILAGYNLGTLTNSKIFATLQAFMFEGGSPVMRPSLNFDQDEEKTPGKNVYLENSLL